MGEPPLSQQRGSSGRQTRPNLVWILTDDQDQTLGGSFPPLAPGGATPMPKAKAFLQDGGTHAGNWYIHTPICSPSRSELLTGRYFHNLKRVGGGIPCAGMHVNYTTVSENLFARILKEAGYSTGLFGKYLNDMPASPPEGFDAWLANDGGDYIAPTFQTKNIDGLPDGHVQFSNDPSNYSTAVIGNASIAWIRKVARQGRPFFAYIAPKAAHEPFNPALWYRDHWDASWPDREPRPVNWNCSAASRRWHHGNIASEPMITDEAAKLIRGVFRNRWRTLMSVDDLVAEVAAAVKEAGLLESTYFLYSSDHGFQLGQFNIPMDKRHVYEWDTKIHLLARGPGIAPGSSFAAPGTQVDIAPTLLGLAGLRSPATMDGRSIAPFLLKGAQQELLPAATRAHLASLGELHTYAEEWRDEVFIEYYFCSPNVKCVVGCSRGDYPRQDSQCVDLANNTGCWCDGKAGDPSCYATEDTANNFAALRRLAPGEDALYAEFQTGDMTAAPIDFTRIDFVEHYDLAKDPWQMVNMAADPALAPRRKALHARLQEWLRCVGEACP